MSGKATVFGYIMEDGAPPSCSCFEDTVVTVAGARRSPALDNYNLSPHGSDLYDDDFVEPPVPVTMTIPARLPPGFTSSNISRTHSAPVGTAWGTSAANLAADVGARRAPQTGPTGPSRSYSASSDFSFASKRQAPRLSSHVPASNPLHNHNEPSHVFTSLPNFLLSDIIKFPAGSYDVVLVIDTREVESKENRDKIAETLAANGIKVETRALRLGDMCWIARRRDGLGGEEDECVLDYVIERKRLDDLCSSIKDGRYTEQCVSALFLCRTRTDVASQFRLSNSCINRIFYIVEDWQLGKHMEYSGLQIMTAKSQIQVHNRFFLKETRQLSETIEFLATMTDVIASSHANRDLSIIPTRLLSKSSYSAFQAHLRKEHPTETFLTSFAAYQDLNDKSASKTLREKFARMLLCVKGMSAERVSSVLEIWETPRKLWEALKADVEVPDESQKKPSKKVRGPETVFADRIQGEGRRKIGDALSREVRVPRIRGPC